MTPTWTITRHERVGDKYIVEIKTDDDPALKDTPNPNFPTGGTKTDEPKTVSGEHTRQFEFPVDHPDLTRDLQEDEYQDITATDAAGNPVVVGRKVTDDNIEAIDGRRTPLHPDAIRDKTLELVRDILTREADSAEAPAGADQLVFDTVGQEL